MARRRSTSPWPPAWPGRQFQSRSTRPPMRNSPRSSMIRSQSVKPIANAARATTGLKVDPGA